MKSFRIFLCLAAVFAGCLQGHSQDRVTNKILETGREDNRTMEYADYLANRIGGRIIGSGALEEAEKWVASQFRSWGLEVVMQEVGEINVGFERGPGPEGCYPRTVWSFTSVLLPIPQGQKDRRKGT